MRNLGQQILKLLGLNKKNESVLDEYQEYFQPKNSNTSIDRKVAAIHSRGNPSLADGRFVSTEDYEKKIEFVANCDLSN